MTFVDNSVLFTSSTEETNMNKAKQQKIIAELTEKFPKVWFREGSDFGGFGWSGEGSEIGKSYAFDGYAYEYDPQELIYTFGVHNDLHNWAQSHGLFWQQYDGGTWSLCEA